jgi:hypothetical protein
MSTKRSAGRSTATHENDCLAVTHKKVDGSAVKLKKDRSGLCCFTFADGRQCRTPRRSGHQHLCYFHAQKEAQARAAREAGEAISSFFFSDYLSACDLSAALGRVFSAVAEGHIKPKAAAALAYLGQTLNQSVQLAQHEYANVFGGDVWRRRVAVCLEPPPPRAPQPVSKPVQPVQLASPPASPPACKPSTSDSSQQCPQGVPARES